MININRSKNTTNINTNDSSEIDIKSTPYIDRLYSCRDLEISNLWQRSIFLAVFLILIFTAYGTLLINALGKFESFSHSIPNSFALYNCLLLVICGIGIIFSLLWIFMSKGSKGWYEIYGEAIADYERCYPTEESKAFGMGKNYLPSYKLNSFILSTSAGAYSVSKVNILIGIVSLMIWSLSGLTHFLLVFCNLVCKDILLSILTSPNCLIWIILVLFLIITGLGIWYIAKYSKSSFLNFNEYTPFCDQEDQESIFPKNIKKQLDKSFEMIKNNYNNLNPIGKERYKYVWDKIQKHNKLDN